VTDTQASHELTDAELVLVVGGDGDPIDVEPDHRSVK
jgi:hypothetical protein